MTRLVFRLLVPSAISGCLLSAVYPPYSTGWLAWFGLVPLIVVVCRCPGPRQALAAAWIASTVQCLLALRWIPSVLVDYGSVSKPLAGSLFAAMSVMLGASPAVPVGLARLVTKNPAAVVLLIPFGWVLHELVLTSFPFGGFPWLLLGYSQTDWKWVSGVSAVTGVYGASFLVVVVNCAVAGFVTLPSRGLRLRVGAGAAALVCAGLALGRSELWRETGRATHSVAMLQANISMDESDEIRTRKFLEGYTEMGRRLPAGSADLLIIPESPSPLIFQFDERYRSAMAALARRHPLGMVLSNIAFDGHDSASRYFNSAYFLGPDGSERGRYDKVKLVPFGEYVPMQGLLGVAESISKDVGGFTPGRDLVAVPLGSSGPASALICFEAVFPQLSRGMVAGGAQVLINLSNDGWFRDTDAPHQHLNIARWRAMENHRYLLRATNSGITAVIKPDGTVTGPSGVLTEGVFTGRFSFESGTTQYTRRGDLFAAACAMIFVLSVCAAGLAGRLAHRRLPSGRAEC
jgi:apolipoprotein N-acyltransferase